jgi:hypothetical protein
MRSYDLLIAQLHQLSPVNQPTSLHSTRLTKEIAAEERASQAHGMREVLWNRLYNPD